VLIAQMYLRPGSTVVVEFPRWPGCLDVFRAAGTALVCVELDAEGIMPNGTSLPFASIVRHWLMPTYHNPTRVLIQGRSKIIRG